MQTECSAESSVFGRVEGRLVVADFDGGALTSDAGGLLPGAADRTIDLVQGSWDVSATRETRGSLSTLVATLVGQRCSASRSATRT